MGDNGEVEDKPPAPPMRIMSHGGTTKDVGTLGPACRPLPSAPDEKKTMSRLVSIFGIDKREYGKSGFLNVPSAF